MWSSSSSFVMPLSLFICVSWSGFCVYCASKVRLLPQLWLNFSPENNSQRQGRSRKLRFLLDMQLLRSNLFGRRTRFAIKSFCNDKLFANVLCSLIWFIHGFLQQFSPLYKSKPANFVVTEKIYCCLFLGNFFNGKSSYLNMCIFVEINCHLQVSCGWQYG